MNKLDILDEREAAAKLSAAGATFAKVRDSLNAVIFGQEEVIEQTGQRRMQKKLRKTFGQYFVRCGHLHTTQGPDSAHRSSTDSV